MKKRIIIKELIGKKFGRLIVTDTANRKFSVLCDCGNQKIVFAQDVYLGKTKSCGCLAKQTNTKHGLLKNCGDDLDKATYRSYASMKQRCFNKNSSWFKNYGGRGIKVCDAWINSFEQFHKDMGRRPSLKHSIDRIDNDGDYTPKNCKWSLHEEQMQHTTNTINVTLNGLTKSLEWWCRLHGVCSNTIRGQIKRGIYKTYEEAISSPKKPQTKDDQGRFLSQYKLLPHAPL